MRTCQSCGRENAPDRDFCECGAYLRWEPTRVVPAVTPASGADAATPEPAPTTSAPPPADAAPAPPAPLPAVPPPESEPAAITLRVPGEEGEKAETLAVGVHPGERARVTALVRNQSGIVDIYQLSVEGMPDAWWSVLPDTVSLVPYGSGGTYEQEVEIQLHPPRTAEAEARMWNLQVVAHSKALERVAASEPLVLGIQPFEQHETKVTPERVSGRRKASFEVAVRNTANAPAVVAFDASEADGDCRFAFSPPVAEIEPGKTVQTTLRVKPPKQIWIGRPHERRLDIATRTGEEATALQSGADAQDVDDEGGGGLLGRASAGVPGVRGPKIGKPKVSVGAGGVNVKKPMVRGPQLAGLSKLKMPGAQTPPAVAGPLLPTQAVFRQKPWLPWWVTIVIPLLALLALLLFLFLPKNVEVPDVVGKKSAFEAQKAVTEAGLRLAPQTKNKVDAKVPPGTVLSQTPNAGETAEKDSEVSILVAVGDGKVAVPDLAGKTPADAEKALREAGLTLGQVTPQPVDPKAAIKSQIPAAKEILEEGAPVAVFTVVPGADKKDGAKAGGGASGAAGADGGGSVKVPAIAGAAQDAYAQKAADEGLVPKVKRAFDESEQGTVFRVEPKPGAEVEAGATVTLFVSVGSPQLAYDNDKDILLVNAANGKKLDPVAKGPQDEHDPTWSADGSAIAYTGNGRIFLSNREKPDESPRALSKRGERFSDLAWAPTTDTNVMAMARITDGKSDLCLGAIDGRRMTTRCKDEPGTSIEHEVNWAPDGKSILAWGFKRDTLRFGMVRWKTKKPFSSDPDDYSKGKIVTDASKAGEGVLDAAISPDGKRMAVASLGSDGRTELFMTKRGDFLLAEAKPLDVRACKVIWRPDGEQLVVMRADDCIQAATGDLVRLPVDDPSDQKQLVLGGDNPVFRPLPNVENGQG